MRKKCVVMLILLIGIFFSGCGKVETEVKDISEKNNISISTEVVEKNKIYEKCYGIGKLKAEREYEIMTGQVGRVIMTNFEVGSYVEKDKILFQMENESLKRNIINSDVGLKNQMDSSKIILEDSKKNYKQIKSLYDSGSVSMNDFIDSQNKFKQAELNYNTMKKNYNVTRENNSKILSDTYVKSPLSGVVVKKYVLENQDVQNQIAYKVIDPYEMIATIGVNGNDIDKVNIGQDVDVYFDEDRSKSVKGIVKSVSMVSEDSTFLYPVEIKINNKDLTLKVGMYIDASIIVSERNNVVTVPRNSIVDFADNPHVFINNNGVAEIKYIKLGYNNDGIIEVIDGLDVGDELIVRGQNFIKDGYLVSKIN